MDLIFSESKVYEYFLGTSLGGIKYTYAVKPIVKAYWNKEHKIGYVYLFLECEGAEWLKEDTKNKLMEFLKDLLDGQKILEFYHSSASAIRKAIELFDVYCQAISDSASRFGIDDEFVEIID